MLVTHLYTHPLKSAASLSVGGLEILPRGPAHDRRWMVVDASGRFVTGRTLPQLVRVHARPVPGGLLLDAPGRAGLHVPAPAADAAHVEVEIWGDRVRAPLAAAEAGDWLSAYLGQQVQLVHMDRDAVRPVDPAHARAGDEVSFADGFPLLLLSARAVHDLGERIGRRMDITRFRPNIVVGNVQAHAEDRWRRLRIAGIEFEVAKPCTRCAFTTVDPSTGQRDGDGEPLRTLSAYRRSGKGVDFGVLLIARGEGRLQLGDRVEVLERLPG